MGASVLSAVFGIVYGIVLSVVFWVVLFIDSGQFSDYRACGNAQNRLRLGQ